MRRAWLYVVLSGVTAFAFTFPLWLAMRERRLEALADRATVPRAPARAVASHVGDAAQNDERAGR